MALGDKNIIILYGIGISPHDKKKLTDWSCLSIISIRTSFEHQWTGGCDWRRLVALHPEEVSLFFLLLLMTWILSATTKHLLTSCDGCKRVFRRLPTFAYHWTDKSLRHQHASPYILIHISDIQNAIVVTYSSVQCFRTPRQLTPRNPQGNLVFSFFFLILVENHYVTANVDGSLRGERRASRKVCSTSRFRVKPSKYAGTSKNDGALTDNDLGRPIKIHQLSRSFFPRERGSPPLDPF